MGRPVLLAQRDDDSSALCLSTLGPGANVHCAFFVLAHIDARKLVAV